MTFQKRQNYRESEKKSVVRGRREGQIGGAKGIVRAVKLLCMIVV